jgi:hypothetical protein
MMVLCSLPEAKLTNGFSFSHNIYKLVNVVIFICIYKIFSYASLIILLNIYVKTIII